MRSRIAALGIIAGGASILGCTAILGSFTTDGSARPSDGGGTDGPTDIDGTTSTDGGSDGDAPLGLRCAFLPNSMRKVADLKTNAMGDRRYDNVAVVSINDSAVRIIPKTSGATGDTLTVYSVRTDKPADNPNVATLPNARFNEVRHRKAPGGAGEVVILTSPGGSSYAVYSMPDSDTNGGLGSPQTLVTPDLPGGARATILPIAHGDVWSLAEYQTGNAFTIGTIHATNGNAGTFFSSSASGSDAFSTDFINLVPVGQDVYAFNAGNIGSGAQLTQWKFPLTPTANDGTSRQGIGTDMIPIGALPVMSGTAVQVTLGKLGIDPNTMSISSIEVATGVVTNAQFNTFGYTDLKKAITLSDPDRFAFGPKSALVYYPGHLAFLGKGALTTSTGLNFVLIDAANGTVEYNASGTGQNLLQGNTKIESIAMDYAPPSFGTSFSYDVVWTENVIDPGNGDYDVLLYQKLQCDP